MEGRSVTTSANIDARAATYAVDSPYAWMRLATSVLLSTIGGVGMWSFVVALPAVQTEFAVDRAAASLPFTLTMIGFGIGGVLMGWLSDRFGLIVPVVLGGISLALGYVLTGYATTLWQFTIAYGVLIGFGSSATLGPMMADISHWFVRRRAMAQHHQRDRHDRHRAEEADADLRRAQSVGGNEVLNDRRPHRAGERIAR